MRAAALIVAAEKYADPKLNLTGPADDAVKMRDWLLGHGGVAAADMTVLVSPRAGWRCNGKIDGDATLDSLFFHLSRLSMLGAERLYFYFSGHGIAVASDRKRQYLLMADFHEYNAPHKAAVFQEITGYFQSFAAEYLLISDACRNFRFGERLATIGTNLPAAQWVTGLPDGSPAPRGGQIFAASPGGFAYISPDSRNSGSLFTTELLGGLAGNGCAKRWDPSRGDYVVDVPQVLRYVRRAVGERLSGRRGVDAEKAAAGIEQDTTQDPLVLRVIQKADVPKVRLSVALHPDAVALASPALQVRIDELVYKKWKFASTDLPLVKSFMLQPRCYSLTAKASGYLQETVPFPCELYEDEQETVRLVPSADRGAPGTPPPGMPPGPQRGEAGDTAGTLIVRNDDPVVPFEVASESGSVLSVGAGNAAFPLTAGYFRVRPLVGGDGSFGDRAADRFYGGSHITGPEWLVQVRAGTESTVRLPSVKALPSRLQPALLGLIASRPRSNQRWASWFGTTADPPVSSLLAYLGELLARDLFRLQDAYLGGSRFVVLAAVDSDREDEARDVTGRLEVRIDGQDSRVGARSPTFNEIGAAGLALATDLVPPGAITIRIGPKNSGAVDVRVPVLADRPTALIWHVDRTGRLEVRISCPRWDGPADYGRRIELMQQLAGLGRPSALLTVAEPLLQAGAADPIAALIAATALGGMPALAQLELKRTEDRLMPDAILADEQVFHARQQELRGPTQLAGLLYSQLAAVRVLPVTAAAARLLLAGLIRHAPNSPHATELEHALRYQMPGSPWLAAWVREATGQGLPTPPTTHRIAGPGVELKVPARAERREPVQATAYA
jgi:hypothetical protein